MNKEYTKIGNYVHIRDDEGHLRKIDAKKDIEKYLVEENNLEMLVKMINEEEENYFKFIIQNGRGYVRLDKVKKVADVGINLVNAYFLGMSLLSSISPQAYLIPVSVYAGTKITTKVVENRKVRQIKKQAKSIKLSMKVYNNEFEKTINRIKDLSESKKTNYQDVKIETIDVPDDKEFDMRIMNQLAIADTVVEKEKKLQKLQKSGKLDSYLDKIGCREEDKSMYKELLGHLQNDDKEIIKVKTVSK